MRFISYFLVFGASCAAALKNPHSRVVRLGSRALSPVTPADLPRASGKSKYLNENTTKFSVNGSALPEFTFDIGESYAGTLPISTDPNDVNRLWFWFFPSSNPLADQEITLWLNGGPGCSSLDGVIQENGPFLWQPGTYQPIPNPYSWSNLTNMIYVDQPVTTGFSTGNITINDENDVARHFLGFWKNFISAFQMEGYKIYISGESYAGQYIPYIASAMLDTNDTSYYNVKGVQLNSPFINGGDVLIQAPAVPTLNRFQNVIGLNESFLGSLNERAKACGYVDFVEKYATTFPPSGPIPKLRYSYRRECVFWEDIVQAAIYINPCFNPDRLTEGCPFLWDILDYASLAGGPNNYFNRTDVQQAINAPPTSFGLCHKRPSMFPYNDQSVASGLGPLPSVIERTNNVIIANGMLDFLIFANGSLITIQNMTWNGYQGFQSAPSKDKYILTPYHRSLEEIFDGIDAMHAAQHPIYDTAGAGIQGNWHRERGLTFVTINMAGHTMPRHTPGVAYRLLEYMLGRIENLESRGPYTT